MEAGSAKGKVSINSDPMYSNCAPVDLLAGIFGLQS